MREVTLIPFKAEHYAAMDVSDRCRALYRSKAFLRRLRENECPGLAYTGLVGDTVVGCGGVKPIWEGVGEAWAVYPEDRAAWRWAIARLTVQVLRRVIQDHHFHRVQAIVPVNYTPGMRFVRWLGFDLEARLRKYTPDGEDCYLYAWTN